MFIRKYNKQVSEMQEHYNDMIQASNNFDDKDFETMSAKMG
jgi:hypothetical protein